MNKKPSITGGGIPPPKRKRRLYRRSQQQNDTTELLARSLAALVICTMVVAILLSFAIEIQTTIITSSKSYDFPISRSQQDHPIVLRSKATLTTALLQHNTTNQEGASSLLEPFKAKHAPILTSKADVDDVLAGRRRPVRIRVLLFEHKSLKNQQVFRPGPTGAISDEILNICIDGFNQSRYFDFVGATVVPDYHDVNNHPNNNNNNFVLQEDEDIVWVIDERRRIYNVSYTIPAQLAHAVHATRQYQRQRAAAAADPDNNNYRIPSLKVVFMDYRDHFFKTTCTKGVSDVIQMLGADNVRQVRRSLVQGRHWDDARSFPVAGRIWVSPGDRACWKSPILQVPYSVRSDYAQAVEKGFSNYLAADSSNDEPLTPADTTRPIDVAHFWPVTQPSSLAARLRHAVTQVVLSLKNKTSFQDGGDSVGQSSSSSSSSSPLRVIADFVSTAGYTGRTQVQAGYLKALLTSKIVIVAQRDEWEDHYRLMEGLVGGAMVMTDPMLTLPDGLVHGENIIVYRSLDHLKQLVLYYLEHNEERLEIARAGWKLAMKRHRTYHWMEELFFGSKLSP